MTHQTIVIATIPKQNFFIVKVRLPGVSIMILSDLHARSIFSGNFFLSSKRAFALLGVHDVRRLPRRVRACDGAAVDDRVGELLRLVARSSATPELAAFRHLGHVLRRQGVFWTPFVAAAVLLSGIVVRCRARARKLSRSRLCAQLRLQMGWEMGYRIGPLGRQWFCVWQNNNEKEK